MEFCFFLFLFLSFYSYIIYPICLFAAARITSRKWIQEDFLPIVSVVISAYNEEGVIEEKLLNTIALDYPDDLVEIFVSSDGSTDRTNSIVTNIGDPRVLLRAFPERTGKTACLNMVVPMAHGEVILFTDANSMFSQDQLKKIVRNFASPDVGLVTGWTSYRDITGEVQSPGLYARSERLTKQLESQISSCVGADGAVFAMRKQLYQSLQKYDINDFVIPLNVIKQGKRVVIDPEVFCLEPTAPGAKKEYRRQVRITTRTLGAIGRNLTLLNPFLFGSFSFFLFSHKVMRFLMPFFLILTFAINLVLLKGSAIYKITLAAQLAIVLIGIGSMVGLRMGWIGDVAKFLLVTLSAQFIAWFRTFAGISDTIWTPQR